MGFNSGFKGLTQEQLDKVKKLHTVVILSQ